MASKRRKAKVIPFITREQLEKKIFARRYAAAQKAILARAAKLDW